MKDVSSSCCTTKGKMFNQIVVSGGNPCEDCPAESRLRMKGYYCEFCRPGYQQNEGTTENPASFGCKACGKGEYKSAAGPGLCEKCPEGTTTAVEGQSKCVKVV